ncbi:MAG: hypothetical protein Ct9H300mP3_03910 [Gammaproteobacteria bacterium]|nr:MAG: hypothetical protein Ct9H300mP3_03910 [Gammaproteobacteria bacterium]
MWIVNFKTYNSCGNFAKFSKAFDMSKLKLFNDLSIFTEAIRASPVVV